jgi:K+-sensing histidine kinase KdpD
MVHDIKSALACIGGFSDHLLSLPEVRGNPSLGTPVQHIGMQAERMSDTVSDQLDYARLGEKPTLNRGRVDVGEVIGEAIDRCGQITTLCHLSTGKKHLTCPSVFGDRRLLGRVLSNLIENAAKHNTAGTEILVDATYGHSRASVVFTCRDDGDGIPADLAPRVFQEFVSGGCEYTACTGLGLAFCKTVVELHGGQIWFESSTGAGTRFLFTIPTYED